MSRVFDRIAAAIRRMQLDAVDVGKPFALLQAAGMKSEVMDKIPRQKGAELKEAVRAGLGGEIGRAFGKLDDRVAKANPCNFADYHIRWTRSDTGRGLVNSVTAVVMTIRCDRVAFRLGNGRTMELGTNDLQMRQLDHAWASTVHAFQGRNVDNAIAVMEAKHPRLSTRKGFSSRSAAPATMPSW